MFKDKEESSLNCWLYGFIPVSIIVVLIILILSYLVSTSYLMAPRSVMNEWACSGKIDTEYDWNLALDDLEVALKLDPWNADIYMDIGRLYEWRALSEDVWNVEAKKARTQASYYFYQAAVHRPVWALAWVNYAQAELLNRKVDDNVFSAISNGFKFGRHQMLTQRKLLWLSIGIWEKLPFNIKRQVRDQVRYTLGRYDGIKMITTIAIRFNWVDELLNLADPGQTDYIETVLSQPHKIREMLRGEGKHKDYVCRIM